MPFTFSHPAIVLPLGKISKKWISLTGLVVGSLAPDFEYFIRLQVKSIYSHTFSGLFWFDLPIGLLLACLFHFIIRDALFYNLPKALQHRFLVFTSFNWKAYFKNHWLVVMFSIILGAGSHLLWDSFTHADGFFVHRLPALSMPVFESVRNIPLYKVLQHGSSLFGMLFIAWMIYRLPIENERPRNISPSYWVRVITICLILLIIRFMGWPGDWTLGNGIVTAIAGIIAGFVLTPILMEEYV